MHHKNEKHLGLRLNNIRDGVGQDLSAQLIEGNSSFQSIDLCGNDIGKGAVVIGAALAKAKLYKINLSENGIGDSGIVSIADAINLGATTASIILDGNMDITQSGVDALYKAMSKSSTVHQTEVTLYKTHGAWYLRCGRSGDEKFTDNPEDHDMKLDKISDIRDICNTNKINIESELGFVEIDTPDIEGVNFTDLFCLLAAELCSYVAAGMKVSDLPEMLSSQEGWESEVYRADFTGSHGAVFEVLE